MADSIQDTTPAHEYTIDFIVCVDGTAAMKPKGEFIQKMIQALLEKMARVCTSSSESFSFPRAIKENGLRASLIVFRDFTDPTAAPLEQSRFYQVQDESEAAEFDRLVNGVRFEGGSGGPVNALEAIAAALRSDWAQGNRRSRQIILVFSSACAYDLQSPSCVKNPLYPANMPRDAEELMALWEGNADPETAETMAPFFRPKYGRLISFVPMDGGDQGAPSADRIVHWMDMSAWSRTWLIPVKLDDVYGEAEFSETIIALFGDV